MFPTRGLLSKSVTCPDYATCTLSPCIFSHAPPASAAPGPQPRPAASVPQKRPAADSPEAGPSQRPKTVNAYNAQAHQAHISKAATAETKSRAAVVKGKAPLVDAGPPRVANALGPAHTPSVTRQKLLTALYDQFLIAYAALPDQSRARSLASTHAKAQEQTLFSRSNKVTYRNAVISALARLKKRSPVMSEDDPGCGTLEDEAEALKRLEETEKGRLTKVKLKRFVHSKDVLAKFGYDVEVPPGIGGSRPTEEGNIIKCDRCGKEFIVKANPSESEGAACSYHWGRQITEKIKGTKHRVWSCCPTPNAPTCSTGPHVFKDTTTEALHSRIGFLPSRLVTSCTADRPALPILALDCELVYTTSGMALARLTVIDDTGKVVLDSHVRPHGSVLDLNTRFSGVKEQDLEGVSTDLKDVRDKLGEILDQETILVGHGLENDLKALRLVHLSVIDTAILFPHPNGGTWRHALRNLTREHLGKFIQDGHSGHSAVEDSEAALELVRFKMKQTLASGR